MLRSILITTAMSLGLAGAASAATHTFDLANDGVTKQSERSFTYGDLALTVTGVLYDYDVRTGKAVFEPVRTQSWDRGIGIDTGRYLDSHLVDGAGKREALIFSFNKDVKLDSVSFSYWDWNDNFALATGETTDLKGIFGSGISFDHTETFSKNYTSNIFAIGAVGSDDEYKVKSLTVSYEDMPTPSPVPLPAAAWMLIAGIGTLAAAKRRKV